MPPLTTALSKLLNCKAENLAEYLNNPEAVNKASAYLRGKKLKTTYSNKGGTTKEVEFGNFSLKSASDTYAFEGFLGKWLFCKHSLTLKSSEVKVHQYFYIKHRIRLLYPQLKCIVEYHSKGHCKYYPLELLAFEDSAEGTGEKPTDTNYLDYLGFRKMKRSRPSQEFPEIEFNVNTMGVTVYSPSRLKTPRFVPWDQPGRCTRCKSGNVELDYFIQPEGVTIFSSRLKDDGENFLPFDEIVDFGDNAKFRVRSRNKIFTLPLRHPEVHQVAQVAAEAIGLLADVPPMAEPNDDDNADPKINERELKFPIPSGIVVSGPSSSGKTQLVLRLLAHANEMFDPPPKVIVWAYGEYSSQIPELERQGVVPHAGPPSEEMMKKLPKPFLIVYDDLMGDIDAKKLADLYTKKSHHNNFSVIFLTQNLFDKAMRVPRSNAQYIFLMRAPSDMLSIRNLASQMFPREHGFLMDAYKQACADPYGYLLKQTVGQRVLDNYEYLKVLGRTTSHKKRRHLLSSAGCEELLTLVEICLNLLNGSFCLTRKQKQKLLPFANTIRRLARVRSEQSARKLILQQPQQEGARAGVGGVKEDDDVAGQTNMGFVKQQLETVKRKRAGNVSERNVLYNQQLRRYLKLRKEAKDRPVKVKLSNGTQLLNKTVETGVQVRPGPDESKDKSVLFAGEDEEIEVPTPIRPGNSRSPRTNKKAAKQQEINEKKDHLLAIIMSDPQSFGATDRGKILNPKTGREFIDSDLNWSIERLVDPRPENAPSPSGTKELMRKLAQNPLATVKKKHPKLKRTDFDDFLQRNTTYTLFKPKREKFRRLRTVPTGFMTDVQADLADFQTLSRKNSGYRYLLLAVDVLSRRMFGSPVKSKRPADVKRAFEEVFGQMPKLPETLYTDRGLEFVAKTMKEFFAENGIKKYETSSKKKAAVAERAIRTLKTRLYKYFSAKNTSAWVDVLPKFLTAINNSVCRATGLKPNEISDVNAREVWKRVYGEGLVPAKKRPKIKAGETVRIPEPKHIFEKGYIPNYSDHVHTVDEARSTNPQHYLLKDYYGTKLKRKFYLPEITKVQVDENTMYRIEKKYKERMRDGKKEILVKFIGFPEKYWVTDEDFEK
ncbi:hypothetical protein niasHS_005411 [Heterodera schachtii]|uniref:Integrase catalytic domain-containing protein n=1 Tax=Heterodera schachtii TaxID=97005 RepID=A0ABD2J9F5_HETSC